MGKMQFQAHLGFQVFICVQYNENSFPIAFSFGVAQESFHYCFETYPGHFLFRWKTGHLQGVHNWLSKNARLGLTNSRQTYQHLNH